LGVFASCVTIRVWAAELGVCAEALLVAKAIAQKTRQDIANVFIQDIALKKREDITPKIEQKKTEKKLRMLRR
jgi:cytidine deaminase